MLLRRVEEELTPIMLNTWESKTISGSLEDKVGRKQVQLGTFAPIKDEVCCQGKKNCDTLRPFHCGRKIRTVGDLSRFLVGVWLCETSSSEQE